MPVLIPRIRTIGVRLSEKEYSALKRFSIKSGARSLSDVARMAIGDFVHRSTPDPALGFAAGGHAALVDELKQKLERLTAEIEFLKASKRDD